MRASSLGNQTQKIPRIEVELGKINKTIAAVNAFITSFGKAVFGDGNMIYSNPQTIDEDLIVPDKVNAVSMGPITIKDCTVKITGSSNWKVL